MPSVRLYGFWLCLVLGAGLTTQAQLAASSLPPSVDTPVQTVTQVARMAAAAAAQGDWKTAVRQYRHALRLEPNLPRVLVNLGAAYAHLGDLGQAAGAYRQALKLDPELLTPRLDLALAEYKTGNLPDAARDLALFHRARPAELQASLLLASCDLSLGRYAAAIQVARPLAASRPGNLAVAYILGTAYIRQGHLQRGGRWINRIMARGNSPIVHLMLGDAYSQRHQLKQARAQYRQAIAMAPRLPLAHLRLAMAQLLSGNSAGAFKNFQAEYALNPNNFETNFYLGYLYRQQGNWFQSVQYLKRAIAMSPEAFQPQLQLGMTELDAHHPHRALRRLRAAARLNTRDLRSLIQAHVLIGRVDYELGQPAAGRREQAMVRRLIARQQARATAMGEREGHSLTPLPSSSQSSPKPS